MNGEQAERILSETASFWARVEILGRRVYNGKVTIETLGGSALLRVDVPIIPEHTVRENGYYRADGATGMEYCQYDVTYPVTPGHSHLIGISSIYELTPLPEDAVLKLAATAAVKGEPIKITKVVEAKQVEAPKEAQPQAEPIGHQPIVRAMREPKCFGCCDDPCTCNDPF